MSVYSQDKKDASPHSEIQIGDIEATSLEKDGLERHYTLFSAYSFAVSISGLFSTIGTSFTYPLLAGGGPAIVWSWFIAGAGCLLIAFSVAELVSAYPTSGGMYHASYHVFPRNVSPFMSWLDGWLAFLGQIAITASSEYGGAQMLLAAISMCTDFSYQPTAAETVGVVAAMIFAHGLVNCLPMKYVEKCTRFYTIFHFSAMITGAIALLAKTEPRNNAKYVFTHVETNSGWSPEGWSFIFGFLSVSWSMTLYDGTAHMADCLKRPERNAPWAISGGMLTTYVLGFLYNIVLAFCMKDVGSIVDESLPVSAIYYNGLGKGGGIAYTFFMFAVMNFVGISVLQSASWSTWAQARDNMFPGARKYLGYIYPRTGTPIFSIILCTILSICVNLIGLGSSTTINAIFNVTAIALDWCAIIPVIGKLCYPQNFRPGPWNLGRFSKPINYAAVAWVLFVTVVFCMPYSMPVTAIDMNYAVVFFVFTIAAAGLSWICGCNRLYRGPLDII